LVIHLFRVV